jgi:hypothetical protein
MAQLALQYYGASVREVRRALADGGERLGEDSLLATVMLLAVYEKYEGGEKRDVAWAAHVHGASRLIDARSGSGSGGGDGGRGLGDTKFGRALRRAHRHEELICAIGTRNKSRRGVEGMSRAVIEDLTPLERQIHYILASLPEIMALSDGVRMMDDGEEIRRVVLEISRHVDQLLEELALFEDALEQSQAGPVFWEVPSQLAKTAKAGSVARTFSTYLEFPDFGTAAVQVLAWTAQLILHSTRFLTVAWVRINRPHADIDSTISLDVPAGIAECDHLAIHIMKSFEYFLQPQTGLMGVQELTFAIPPVLGYCIFWQKHEQAWFVTIFARLRDLNVGIEGFLTDSFEGSDLKMIRPLDPEQKAKVTREILRRVSKESLYTSR